MSLHGCSVPLLEKVPLGAAASPNHLLAFHTDQLSDQSRVYLCHGQSWPNSSLCPRSHLVLQILWYCPSWQLLPQPGYVAGYVSLAAFLSPSSDFMHLGLSWLGLGLPALGGKGATRLLSLTWLSTNAPAAAMVSGARPEDLPVGLQNLLTACFEVSSTHFVIQTSYQLEFCWLFILFFSKSARCPGWVH